MSQRKYTEGRCHLCGSYGELTFEHIPPQRAFNNRKTVSLSFEKAIRLGPDVVPRGPIHQRGVGAYTLCGSCNSRTGAWYAPGFIDWCYQGMEVLRLSDGHPSLFSLHYLFPLRVIKQIVTMFASVNSEWFGRKHPELVKFVLDKERKYLPDRYRLYAFYNLSDRFRYYGFVGRGDVLTSQVVLFSEITYPPFGYVMTADSGPPDNRLVDITDFASYDYSRFMVGSVRMPCLSVATHIPADYRRREEIQRIDPKLEVEQTRLSESQMKDWKDSIEDASSRIDRNI